MGLNLLSSANDPICPTYAAGTISKISTNNPSDIVSDYYSQFTSITGSTVRNGSINTYESGYNGSTNASWNNGVLTQSVTPTYGSGGLLSFGNTGLQS